MSIIFELFEHPVKNKERNTKKYIHKVFELSAMEIEHIGESYSLRHGKIEKERLDKNYLDCDFSQIAT